MYINNRFFIKCFDNFLLYLPIILWTLYIKKVQQIAKGINNYVINLYSLCSIFDKTNKFTKIKTKKKGNFVKNEL